MNSFQRGCPSLPLIPPPLLILSLVTLSKPHVDHHFLASLELQFHQTPESDHPFHLATLRSQTWSFSTPPLAFLLLLENLVFLSLMLSLPPPILSIQYP